jgi:signal transduction histidine kinase/CheY-like chemotaxis protein
MTATMRPGYALSKPHHHYGMGTLRQLPTILFEKSAHVTLETYEASVRYQIKLPRANPWAYLRRRVYRSRPKPIFMQIMRETFSQLAARQILLQEESSRRLEAESKLAHVEKMEALGNLTGGIAHDFNNLLSVVVGQLDMLQMDLKDPDMRRRVNDALAAAQRGAALTQQLLAFGRQSLLHPVVMDANHAIESIIDVLAVTVGETISVNFSGHPKPCGILVDHNQLENALLNIAINARDAMPEGGSLDIEIISEHLDETILKQRGLELEPDEYVVISVTDHGTGISEDVLSHAFEPFFTTKETDKGTGLGLSMVWGFLQQSNGSALIKSKVNKGTTVSMYLPKVSLQVAQAVATAKQERSEPLREGLKVLVVEDQKAVRNVVSDMLTSLGTTVTVVEDGQSALGALSSDNFDLLITDIVLPGGMLGPDIVSQARSTHPELKVAFMSGHVQTPREVEFKHVNSDNLLYKPFTLNTLQSTITRVMQD